MNFSESNRYVKELKSFLKYNFPKIPAYAYTKILNIGEQIILDKKINITQLFDSDKTKWFKIQNSARLDGDEFKINYVEAIIDILQKIISEESKPNVLINETRGKDYKNVIIKDGELYPDSDFDIKSLKLNLFYNNKIEFNFNEKIPVKPLDCSFSFVQSLKLEINGSGEQIIFPTKYEVICTARVKGIECGNLINFCDIHKNSQITCSDAPLKNHVGHMIKKIDNAPIKESAILFSYDGKDVLNEKSKDLKIFSLTEINKEKFVCNAIYVVENHDEYLIILGIREEDDDIKTLNYDILLKDDKSRHFLDDIYRSLQIYFKKEHDIIITNQNKIVGEIIIFIALNKIFYDLRMNALIIGSSGSGKSFWASYVIPMFTFNYKVVSGSDITRNKFLGGRSNIISSFKNSLFQIGFMGTQDIIFLEEATEPLNRYFDPKDFNKESNLFNMLKIASSPYDVGIQGSQSVVPKASCIMVGNFEQLSHVEFYKNKVMMKYTNFMGGVHNYKNKWPLFKPLEHYSIEELARAHQYVRKHNWKGHYIVKLPDAELSRLNFMVALEDEETEFKKIEMEHETTIKKIHRTEFVNELKNIFNQKISIEFKKIIWDYYNDEFLKNRNNFMPNGYKKINTHTLKKQFEIISQFIFMNKLYYKQPMELNEMDKRLTENFLLYNYNCIGAEEAALIKQPFINDYLGVIDDDLLINYDRQKRDEYIKKVEDDKKEIQDLVDKDKENLLGDK